LLRRHVEGREMNGYIENAKRFYEEARKEFERGKRENDMIRIRDASEKAWNAMVQATNGLFENKGSPIPATHRERRRGLDELTMADGTLKVLGLRDRFAARSESLHEKCFYEGYCPIALLEEDFEKVKGYIEDIERITKR
jgi:hypothetical protein